VLAVGGVRLSRYEILMIFLRLIALIAALFLLPAISPAADAESLLAHAKRTAGIALVAPVGQGALALDLAQQPGWQVIAVDPDPQVLRALETNADAQARSGRTLFPVEGDPEHLPIANHLVDLAFVRGSDLTESGWAQLARVVSPVRGTLFIFGDPAVGAPDPQIWQADSEPLPEGVSMVLRRQALPGSAWWTHRMHDAGNNAASSDTALTTPIGLQYLATPLHTSFQGVAMTSNGRHIEISDSAVKNPSREKLASRIRARSIYNGTIIWETALPEGYEPDFPTAALAGDVILIAHPDQPSVLLLDGETGGGLGEIAVHDDEALRIQWIGVEGDRLFALLGPPFPRKQAFSWIGDRANKAAIADRSLLGSQIVAVDLRTREPLWRHEEGGKVDYRQIGVRNGQVVFYHFGKRLACLDENGKVLWENQDPEWLETVQSPEAGGNLNTQSSPLLTIGENFLRLGSHRSKAYFFQLSDGKMTAPTGGPSYKGFFLDGQYRNIHGTTDPATGKKVGEGETIGRYNSVGGCGLVTWIPGLEAGISHSAYGFKSPCGIGTWSAGGALLINPSHCDCSTGTIRGASAFLPVGDLFDRMKNQPEHPLRSFAEAPSTPQVGPADWSQYGGGPRHANDSPATVPTSAPQMLQVASAQPLQPREMHDMLDTTWYDRPTPAVTAGNIALWADSTGQITAVDSGTGQRIWQRQLGAAVLASPVTTDGLVIVPGMDGWVRALALETGDDVWQWRAAPVDRRMMVFGKLTSTWPVGALLIEEGKLYGIAGLAQTLGSVVFCLDTRSGEMQWTSQIEPDFRSGSVLPPDAFAPGGELSLVGDKLWIRSDYVVGIIDTTTGERLPPSELVLKLWKEEIGFYMSQLKVQGRDFVKVRDDLFLMGGNTLFDDTANRWNKKQDYFAYAPDAEGNLDPLVPMAFAIPNSRSAPATDGDAIAMIGGQDSRHVNLGLSYWLVDDWQQSVEQIVETEKAKAEARQAKQGKPKTRFQEMIEKKRERWAHLPTAPRNAFLPLKEAAWAHPDLEANAVVLTANAVLAAHGKARDERSDWRHPGFDQWFLSAYDRTTGTKLWQVELPSEPIYNGLAVDASGRAIVVHRDGAVSIVGTGNLVSQSAGHLVE